MSKPKFKYVFQGNSNRQRGVKEGSPKDIELHAGRNPQAADMTVIDLKDSSSLIHGPL